MNSESEKYRWIHRLRKQIKGTSCRAVGRPDIVVEEGTDEYIRSLLSDSGCREGSEGAQT
eukprot:2787593-Amphidinium_carterae.1